MNCLLAYEINERLRAAIPGTRTAATCDALDKEAGRVPNSSFTLLGLGTSDSIADTYMLLAVPALSTSAFVAAQRPALCGRARTCSPSLKSESDRYSFADPTVILNSFFKKTPALGAPQEGRAHGTRLTPLWSPHQQALRSTTPACRQTPPRVPNRGPPSQLPRRRWTSCLIRASTGVHSRRARWPLRS